MLPSHHVTKSDPWGPEQTTTVAEHSPVPSVRRTKRPFLLEQVQGPGAPREFVLELEEIVIGRSFQAHICIDSSLISRRHIAVRRNGPEYVLADLESKNGMFLNGVKVNSAVLRQGDTIQIGDVVLVYHEGA
jgi:pSer/pThr/pTyr-binding forkhead associated (FHA) protein